MKQLGERFQVMFDVFVHQESATLAGLGRGGSDPRHPGNDRSYQGSSGTGLISQRGLSPLVLRYDHLAQRGTRPEWTTSPLPLGAHGASGRGSLVAAVVRLGGGSVRIQSYAHADWQRRGRMVEIEALAPKSAAIRSAARSAHDPPVVSIGYG